MDVLWLVLLGLFLGGWFVLDGFTLGVGSTLPLLGRDGYGRREVITGVGPFFLANEVWLLAAVGVLVGAFPHFEHDLLLAYYPLVVPLVVAWLLRDAGMWFRSRVARPGWRRGWDRVLTGASILFGLMWGMLLGNLLQGLPGDGPWPGLAALLDPYALLTGVTLVLVLAMHGATFTAMRLTSERRTQAAALARRLAVPAAVALALAAVAGALQQSVRDAAGHPMPALLLVAAGLAAIAGARWWLDQDRPVAAFGASCVAAAVPVLGTGVAVADRLLAGTADPDTLSQLLALAAPAVPVLLLVQAWLWWVFRRRVTSESVVFF